jgi:Tol biopolymer transport system component
MAFYSVASNLVVSDTNGSGDILYADLDGAFDIRRVSVSSTGAQGNSVSFFPALSGNGNVVAFESFASNLITGDTNGTTDVFAYDVTTNQIRRVSVASDGAQANGPSYHASISADGQYIAFVSSASNLVPGDTNGVDDIFLHYRGDFSTIRVSVQDGGTQANGQSRDPWLSGDGRTVVFHSDATNQLPGEMNSVTDVFRVDLLDGTVTRISTATNGTQGNGFSAFGVVSPNGQAYSFESEANNLVPGDTNGQRDAFWLGSTEQPSRTVRLPFIWKSASGGN